MHARASYGGRTRMDRNGHGRWMGNPLERELSAIVDDVREGLVSIEQAHNDYGVLLDPATLQVLELAPGRQS